MIRNIFAGAFMLLLILAMLDAASVSINWASLDVPVIEGAFDFPFIKMEN